MSSRIKANESGDRELPQALLKGTQMLVLEILNHCQRVATWEVRYVE